MDITFGKPPLIELIAELRWMPQGSTSIAPVPPQPPAAPMLFLGGTKQEGFYMGIGAALYNRGFNRSERLSPAGFPFMLQQPVYRFMSEAEDKKSVVYQVGYGIFSVHAVPPYHSWSKFLPFVTDGVEILLGSRLEADSKLPLEQVSLHYIDFFGQELMQGQDVQSFVSGVLGISVILPEAITKPAASKRIKGLYTKVGLPIKIGELTLSVGDGQFSGQNGVLLDWLASSHEVAPDRTAIMEVLGSAHDLIHRSFLELTRPIFQLMEPQAASTL
jgi:uncharacterized protein (TIGR04255 family)